MSNKVLFLMPPVSEKVFDHNVIEHIIFFFFIIHWLAKIQWRSEMLPKIQWRSEMLPKIQWWSEMLPIKQWRSEILPII